jgi:hypothetical protein
MKKNNAGFSLVEFVTCNLATMIMLGATFTLLTMLLTANSSITGMTATQQGIRVGMNTIARDVTMAGTGLPTGGIAVPNGMGASNLLRPGVGGNLPTPNNTMAIISPGDSAGPTINGVVTDAITITSIDQQSPVWNVSAINPAGTQIDFVQDVRAGATQMFVGNLLVFNNANGSVFGMVTNVSTTQSRANFDDADAMDINQPLAEFGNIQSLANMDGTYPPTTATRINVITYYLSTAVANHPRLMRSVNGQTPQIVVDDVENLQFSFDLFDFETSAATANQSTTGVPNQIRSVSVSLSGRSSNLLTRAQRYYRFSLVSKINIRNATFRNRYTE